MQFFRGRRSRGRPPHPDVLTPAEWRVLEQLRRGYSNPEIAGHLGLSVPTVKTHVSSMLAKLELPDRDELAAWDGEPLEVSRSALARLRMMAPLGWLREALGSTWLAKAGATGVVIAVSIGAITAISMGQDSLLADRPEPTPRPIASPSPTASPTEPVPPPHQRVITPSFRAFTAEVDEAIRTSDTEFFRARADTVLRACSENDMRVGFPGHGCDQPGQLYEGFSTSYWRSDGGGYIPVSNAMGLIEQLWSRSVDGTSDEFNDAGPTLYAIGTHNHDAAPFAAVLTAIIDPPPNLPPGHPDPLRLVLVTRWTERNGEWWLAAFTYAFTSGEDFLAPNNTMPAWERFEP